MPEKDIIIVHGKPPEARYKNPELSKPHEANWLPWLQTNLAMRGISASIPAMPKPYSPVYSDWRNTFEQQLTNRPLGLVGHSAGAEFILRWMSENPTVELENLALVAPWRDEAGKYGDFSRYRFDTNIPERVHGGMTIYHSTDDSEPIQKNVHRLLGMTSSNVHLRGYTDQGHFMLGNNMTSQDFPDLLAELIDDHQA